MLIRGGVESTIGFSTKFNYSVVAGEIVFQEAQRGRIFNRSSGEVFLHRRTSKGTWDLGNVYEVRQGLEFKKGSLRVGIRSRWTQDDGESGKQFDSVRLSELYGPDWITRHEYEILQAAKSITSAA